MKRILCCLISAMMVCCCALAQISPSPTIQIQLITPMPSPAPAGATFASEDIIVTLPAGMELLDANALAGYEAALQADFPGAARLLLAAANEDHSAVLSFSVLEGDINALAAAQEAAKIILAREDMVSEIQLGENNYAAFTCAIGDQAYHLYFLGEAGRVLIAGAAGLNNAEIETMLAGLIF